MSGDNLSTRNPQRPLILWPSSRAWRKFAPCTTLRLSVKGITEKKRLISSGLELTVMKHDDDDCFYIALFSALEQTHCAPPVILNK